MERQARWALALTLFLIAVARATTEPPTNEINCDDLVSAADVTAAILVSADPARFADCADADDFRQRALSPDDIGYLTSSLFLLAEEETARGAAD